MTVGGKVIVQWEWAWDSARKREERDGVHRALSHEELKRWGFS